MTRKKAIKLLTNYFNSWVKNNNINDKMILFSEDQISRYSHAWNFEYMGKNYVFKLDKRFEVIKEC